MDRDLPEDIRRTLDQLMVDRCGEDPRSYMRTEDVIGHVAPGGWYRIDADRLSATAPPASPPAGPAPGAAPPHVRLRGTWNAEEDPGSSNANIFGGLGTLTIAEGGFAVPAAPATAEALAFYGARLFSLGDTLRFETDRNLPVTVLAIGPASVADFLQVEGRGGGTFIEYHDQPHLHMPLEPDARGHLLLGRAEGGDYLLSAFPIPQGLAVYTPPNVLHADPFLIGRYLVVYAVTEHYSTVVFRSPDGRPVNPEVGT